MVFFTHSVIHHLHRPRANLCMFSGKCIRCRHQIFSSLPVNLTCLV